MRRLGSPGYNNGRQAVRRVCGVDPGSGNGNNGFKNIATSRSIGGDVVAVVAVVAVDVVVVVLGYHCDSRDREGT